MTQDPQLNPELPRDPAHENRGLGNPELPVFDYKQTIIDAVGENQAVVLSAETGAGKSTQVPQFLAEAGYEVIVTQPRVLAARSVAERVAEEVGVPNMVGYRTARERDVHPDNKIVFCTDGLQVVRELAGNGTETGRKQVLVLDEVHEWNVNMEVLVAWAHERMCSDPDFRVVTMSATLDGAALSRFFGPATPHIEVPGRTFEVTKREGAHYIDEICTLAAHDKNILVFLPGKAEIDDASRVLAGKNLGVPIIPLHGQLDRQSQRAAFAKHPGGKIVLATNVAQTSVTIEDIDAVVDTGLERRTEVRGGVEGLYLAPVSQADCLQRAGRAGRTRPGEYILASIDAKPIVPLANRSQYPTPEIQRTRLDNVTLRLAGAGFDIAGMEFFHQPPKGEIEASKQKLKHLGALTDGGELTPIGRRMEKMPLEAHFSRMLVEAEKYPQQVTRWLVDVIAIQQAGGIVKGGRNSQRWRSLCRNTYSDLLAELEVLDAIKSKPRGEWSDYDVLPRNIGQADAIRTQLERALRIRRGREPLGDDQKTALLKCIAAGLIDQIWFESHGNVMAPAIASDITRELSASSVVTSKKCVVGLPFDLEVKGKRGMTTLRLLQSVTAVDPKWLTEIAPQLVYVKPHSNDRLEFDEHGEPYMPGTIRFGNLEIDRVVLEPDPEKIPDALIAQFAYNKSHKLSSLQHWSNELSLLAHEIAVFDPGYSQELQSRFRSLLRDKLIAGDYRNLFHAIEQPPVMHDYEVFTDADIQKVSQIQAMYPRTLILGTQEVVVTYQPAYYGKSHPTAKIRVTLEQFELLVEHPIMQREDLSISCTELSQYELRPANAIELYNLLNEQRLSERLDADAISKGYPRQIGGPERWGTGSNNIRYWVVKPDGELRKPDSGGGWNVLRPGEVYLVASAPSRDIFSNAEYRLEAPDGLTDEQVLAITTIEDGLAGDLNAPLWLAREYDGLNEDELVGRIRSDEWLASILPLRDSSALIRDLMSTTGLNVELNPFVAYEGIDTEKLHFDYEADGRVAAQIDNIEVSDEYAVQVLIYEKYGDWQTAMKLVVTEKNAEPNDDDTDDAAALAALLEKYKR